jgi:CHAT domain-containing protein/tetratricopeptide (TPR) repeat protein
MPKPSYLKILLPIIFLFTSISNVFSQDAPSPLALDQPLERAIKGGEKHVFAVRIGAGETARVSIAQRGVDVSLAAVNPAGERFIETESPSGLLGNDLILVTASAAGEYKIEVSPADPRAAAGKYVIELAEIRPSAAQDFEINRAAAKITKVANETNALRAKGTIEGRRQALEKFQEVVALSKIKQDRVWEVVAVISSGYIYEQLGEMQKALEFYLRGLELSREVGNREYTGTALNNLGGGYKILGDYEQAIFYLNQALAIAREVQDRQGEAIYLNNLGGCYLLLGDITKAEELFRASLTLRRETKDRRGEGNTLNNLGLVFAQSGDRAKEIDFLEQALIVRREIGDRQGEAITLRNLGKSFWNAGEKRQAQESFEKSNALARQLGDRRVEADTFYWLAVVERDRENLPEAIRAVENGLRIIEQIRGELVNPELRTAYFSTVQQFYELYTDLIVARFEKSRDERDVALALQTSERARTRSLVELLQEANVDLRQGVDVKMLEEMQDLQNALNTKYRQRIAAVSRKAPDDQIAKLTNEINRLAADLEKLQVKIRTENPRYAALRQTETLAASEIRNLLDDETVLLEYKLGARRSFLWLVTKTATEIFILPPRAEIEAKAKDFYASIISRKKEDEAKINALAKDLGAVLLAPVGEKINGKRTAIVADGILQYIPFASLTITDYKLQISKSLVERNEIVILPSANVLAEIRRNSTREKAPVKTLAIFADAVFDAADARLASAAKNVKPAEKSSELGRVFRDFDLEKGFPRLLSSRVEARNISVFAPANLVDLNIDFDASRENVTGRNLSDYKILHFATHGLLDTSRPEFSGLVFSLFDKDGKPQDGFLRLNQIYNLDLNSDLVVLSACQTALGKDVRGEGLIGLTRGFMYAGAKSVVASLWKVDDAATAEFMKRFYRNLLQKKLGASAALRAAQIEMKQIPRFRAPYFWAGFTIQGEWREK